jgi:hypothetical protein
MEWHLARYEDVLAAIRECDAVGEEEFLSTHHFRAARSYHLLHQGSAHPSKAILGVAYQHATGTVPDWRDFNGGKLGAAKVLRRLGFQVTGPHP